MEGGRDLISKLEIFRHDCELNSEVPHQHESEPKIVPEIGGSLPKTVSAQKADYFYSWTVSFLRNFHDPK